MKKLLPLLVILLFLFPTILASSVNDEIQKATHYAEEYETGSLTYVEFLLYVSSVRNNINKILGATHEHAGGFLTAEQLEEALGLPSRQTTWAWNEDIKSEERLEAPSPVWDEIVFDGEKIQIRIEAHPSIFIMVGPELEQEMREAKNRDDFKRVRELKTQGTKKLYYWLHFNTEFKRPQDELDIFAKLEEIKSLAEIFSANPTSSNADALAEMSVSTERAFEHYYKQNPSNCEELMASLFGTENLRETAHTSVREIIYYRGDKFDAIIRLEMCEDCEWNWVNMHMWIEGRGRFPHPEGEMGDPGSKERYKGMNFAEFKAETQELLDEITRLFDQGDYMQAMNYANRLQMLTNAWNEVANEVWEEVDQEYKSVYESYENQENQERYWWVKVEQEKRKRVRELRQLNFKDRERFYLDLFSGYDMTESYYEQIEFVKRLIEEFKERGEEICDNNEDDNENGNVDCDDAQCGGKICGRDTIEILEGNETNQTTTKTVDLYCIAGTCQIKEEIIKPKGPICGNHICEQGEEICSSSLIDCNISENDTECSATADCGPIYCPEDCVLCPEHPPIECSGKVIFSGQDENGCPLEPICIPEVEFCDTTENCIQPLCGEVECIRDEPEDEYGKCGVVELKECNETECVDGDKKIERCTTGEEIVKAICVNGLWEPTGIGCEGGEIICCKEIEADDSFNYVWLDKHKCIRGDNKVREVVDDENCRSEECVEEGGRTFAGDPNCCDGLQAVSDCLPNQDCPISVRYCVDCGNAQCDPRENRHNCPEDCKEEITGCAKCGNSCISMEESMRAYCEPPTEEFDCIEQEGRCIKEEKEIAGDECTIKEDCGGLNDVCSNGKCVPLPEIIPVEPEEPPEIPEPEEPEEEEPVEEEPEEEVEEEEEEVEEPEPEAAPEPEPKPEPESNEEPAPVTGEIILTPFRAILGAITGAVTENGEEGGEGDKGDEGGDEPPPEEPPPEEPPPEEPPEPSGDSGGGGGWDGECPDAGEPPETEENCWPKTLYDDRGCVSGYDVECGEWEDDGGGWEDHGGWEEDDWEERRREQCKEECKNKCYDMEIRPCVEPCIMQECGHDFDCDADEVTKLCEDRCLAEKDTRTCEEDCHPRCVEGEDVWEAPEEEEHKEHLGMFEAGGGCRTSQQRTEAYIWINGWGEKYDQIGQLKHKYYQGGHADWCKYDFENLQRQRKEFEQGFTQEFVGWLFNDYLANSAEDWESHMSAIYDLYWKNVDNLRETIHRMQCLGLKKFPDYNLIGPIEYESPHGHGYLKFWEERQTVKIPEMDGKIQEMIVPYMQISISPPRDFIRYEMQDAMKTGRMPGPPEEYGTKEGGLSPKQRAMLREDKEFMENIEDILDEYGGNFRGAMQIVDYDTDKVLFNMLVEVNEKDLIYVTPMLPEKMPAYDVKGQINYQILADIIEMEDGMREGHIESPPWGERKAQPVQRVKEVFNGFQMWLKFNQLQRTARIEPESAKGQVGDLFFDIMELVMGGEGPEDREKEHFDEEEFEEMKGEFDEDFEGKGEGKGDGKGKGGFFTGNMISRF
jgi:hypothetical protein